MLKLAQACLYAVALLLPSVGQAAANGQTESPAVALYYGHKAPLDELRVFDIVVVDADHGYEPKQYNTQDSQLYAYAALTEVHPSRSYFKKLPPQWHLGKNKDWDSVLVDQRIKEWPDFFADQIIAPLWERGYRGFFIDTLDSYRLAKEFDEQQQQDGVVAVIEKLHEKYPGIKLILNRGFEVLPRVKDKVQMVAAESLFQGWNAGQKRYGPVADKDREWLQKQLEVARDEHGVPGLVIDYVSPLDRETTRKTAKQIKALGFTPWVTDHQLHTIGIGSVELVPRRIAVLYNGGAYPAVNYTSAHRFAQMPLNHMGYLAEYFDVRQPMPEGIYGDRYAGVLSWFGGDNVGVLQNNIQRWMYHAMQAKLPLVNMGELGFAMNAAWAKQLGLQFKAPSQGTLRVVHRDPMIGFEKKDLPADRYAYQWLLPEDTSEARALVTVEDTKGQKFTAAAITPWGGFVRSPYAIFPVPGTEDYRWVVEPFTFLQQALRLQPLPAPDVTTENGRRLFFAHIDGDAFPSKAEMPGNRFAADFLLTDILMRYKVPHAVSVIEAEIAPHGLYPQYSEELEGIAKRMFALPHVEIASHTFSHPYLWDLSVRHGLFADNKDAAVNLNVPGYTMDLHREIVGSVDYIRQRLANGKPVDILLWSGDTAPNAQALEIATRNNILNMNGGDTYINKSNPSLTAVQGHGITKNGYLQVYAPVTNENIYTNLWKGPYYGFDRVIETFEMTESPRRLKAVDIYYHTYAASKQASLNSLHKAYQWAAKQPLHHVFPSEYIRKVQDFYGMALARDGEGWRIRTQGHLRTLRMPSSFGNIDAQSSSGIAGYLPRKDEVYVHLTSGSAFLQTNPSAPSMPVILSEANARLTEWITDASGNTQFALKGHAPLEFSLGLSRSCQVTSSGRTLRPHSQTQQAGLSIQSFRISHAAATIQTKCSAS